MKKLNMFKTVPETMKHVLAVETSLHNGLIDPITIELIKTRASQINGCAYCLNMHTVDALKVGETVQRTFLLDAWRETDLFNELEKVVLELTEKLTLVSQNHIDDDLYSRLSKFYSDEQFAYLVLMISQINLWNRLNIAVGNDIDPNYK